MPVANSFRYRIGSVPPPPPNEGEARQFIDEADNKPKAILWTGEIVDFVGPKGDKGAQGNDAAPTVTDARLENRYTLRDFFKSLYNYSLNPDTYRFGISWYGDSVSSGVSGEFIKLLTQEMPRCDLSGPGGLQAELLKTKTGNIIYDGAVATSTDQSVMDGSNGGPDFTYLPSAMHITLGDAATLAWDANQQAGFSEARVYLATGPGMGTALVEVIINTTGAVVASQSMNLTAGSVGATKVQLVGLDMALKYKVRITATGRVVHLWTTLLRPSGILPVGILGRGGSSLTQNNYSNATIFTYVLNDVGTSLIFLTAKEEGLPGSLAPTMARLSSLTNTSKIVVGSLPDSSNAESQISNNTLFRNHALSNGFAYFDGYAVFGSYAELQRLGWIVDGTHPLEGANRYVAGLIASEIQLNSFLSGTLRRTLALDHPSFHARSYDYRMFRGDNTGDHYSVLTTSGGGSPGHALLQNMKRVLFGPNTGTTPGISGYGANAVAAVDRADAWVGFGAKNFFTMGDGLSDNTFNNSLRFTIGKTIRLKEGENAMAGVVTLVAGQAVVATTSVANTSRIKLTPQTLSGISRPAAVGVTSRIHGASFTITSADPADTSQVYWEIMQPSP